MKKKSLAALLSGLLTVSLTGVGFASWLITNGSTETTTGNIAVTEVDDKRCTISGVGITYAKGDSICFGPNAVVNTGWLRADAATENMTATVSFTVANTDFLAGISVSIAQVNLGSDGVYQSTDELYSATEGSYYTAYSDGYVAALPTEANGGIVVSSGTQVESTTSKEYTATITFDWGTDFGGENPFTFYNGKTAAAEADNAIAALTALEALNGAMFKVTIRANV